MKVGSKSPPILDVRSEETPGSEGRRSKKTNNLQSVLRGEVSAASTGATNHPLFRGKAQQKRQVEVTSSTFEAHGNKQLNETQTTHPIMKQAVRQYSVESTSSPEHLENLISPKPSKSK